MGNAVEAWLDSLSPNDREGIERLREIIRTAAPDLTETIKWNAPSFADGDQDRVTLGIERRGGWRMVLHRGAATQEAAGFAFDDPATLARWPAKDRGVVTLKTVEDLEEREAGLVDLVRRWVGVNRAQP